MGDQSLPSSLMRVLKLNSMANRVQMTEGRDYYYESNGLMVFTREFHVAQGECCRSKCRHCPYGFNPEAIPTPEWVSRRYAEKEESTEE